MKLAASDVSSMNEPGQFASNCGTCVGAGLWIARNSRPEISFAVGWLGRYTTKWTQRQDAALHRLMGYLAATQSNALRLVLNPADVQQRTLTLDFSTHLFATVTAVPVHESGILRGLGCRQPAGGRRGAVPDLSEDLVQVGRSSFIADVASRR